MADAKDRVCFSVRFLHPVRRRQAALTALIFIALSGCAFITAPMVDEMHPNHGETKSARSETPDADLKGQPGEGRRHLPGVREGEMIITLTASELQSELLAFADRYMEAIAEVMDWGGDQSDDPVARAGFHGTKVIYVTAAINTATEPDPLRVLRDFLVMLRLQRLVWEAESGHSWAWPEAAARIADTLTVLETQLEMLAIRVVSQEAVDTVYELTRQWRAENPERHYVAFVRFHDIDDSELKRRSETHFNASGLLAPVAEASREINEMRRVAERSLFLANHMPILLEWQAETFMYNTVKFPEFQGYLKDINRFVDAVKEFVVQVKTLPDRVSAERASAIRHFGEVLQQERIGTLEQMADHLRVERESLFRQIDASAGELKPLAENLAVATSSLRETLELVSQLGENGNGEEFELEKLQEVVQDMTRLAGGTREVVQSIKDLTSADASSSGLERLNALIAEHERRIFRYAVALIVLTGAVVCIIVLLLRARRTPQHS